jgi:hypothetical protein
LVSLWYSINRLFFPSIIDGNNNFNEDKLGLSAFEEHNAIGEAAIAPSKTVSKQHYTERKDFLL